MKRIKHLKVLSIAVAFILVFSVVFPLSTRAENSSEEKFTAEQSINGTKVTVSADPEVFPEGTTMEVKEVNLTSTEDSLVASQQQADQKSIKKVALDITMKNKEGQEIEPDTTKGKVHVSFTNDDIKNHTTIVYHIDDNLKVESLKLTKTDDTVTGETTGFSTYILDFVVGNKTIYYDVTLNAETNLSEVLANLLNVDASKITSVIPLNQKDFANYGTLTPRDNLIYLTITKELPTSGNGLGFTVNYTDQTNKAVTTTLRIQVHKQPTFTGDAKWINYYQASRDDHAHTITLTKYNGTGKDLSIPGSVNIDGANYQIVIKGNVYANSYTLESIVFQDGVKADETLASLFYHCPKLTKVDLSALDTSNVTDMSSMFFRCESIVNDGTDSYIKFATKDGPNRFDTSNVKTMADMFYNMQGLVKLDVSMFKITDSLEDMDRFAAANSKLIEIDLSAFKGAVSKNASQANADDALAPLTWSTNLGKITLGKDWKPKDNQRYLGLGITGNWKNIATNDVVTNEDLINFYTSTMAGTYVSATEAPSKATRALYVADGYTKKDNMWEVHTPQYKFHGYCLDHKRLQPSGYYDKVAIDKNAKSNTSPEGEPSNWVMDYLDEGNTGYKELGSNMTEALIALIYWSEYGGNNGPYNQDDVWHFTNDYSSGISAELAKKIEGHTYNDIPNKNKYKLYIYMPSTLNTDPNKDNMQNLLSIEGANDQAYAGVQVKKVDNTSSKAPVSGATFTVYHATDDGTKDLTKKFGTGEDHLEFTTNSSGIGGIYRMDKTLGLTVGKYILEEKSAPSGYMRNNTLFKFDVTEDDDQKLISVGNSNGVIVDDIVTKYSGGGITLKKTDMNSGKALANAEFTLYETDASGNILYKAVDNPQYSKSYLTDDTGIWKTGLKDLEIGKYYKVCETKAPEGYILIPQGTNKPYESPVIKLQSAEENSYKDIGVVTNVPQTVDVQIEATKQFPNVDLGVNKFTFNLLDSQGNVIDTQQNDANGKIKFKKLTLSAADMPGKDYYIEEVPNTPTISGQTITYDTHRETVKVLLETDAHGNLIATVKYSDDTNGAVFVNQLNVNYDGKLNVHKTVTNSLSSSDEFNFYVEIQSPAADLASKEFSYTLDGKTDKFKFNRLSTKTDTGLYRYKTAEGTFKLKDQSTLEFTNLPRGAQYIVTEDEENGYKLVKSENTTGTLTETAVTAKFTNEGNSIIPTSADSMTRMSFWILGTAGALVFVLILKRRLKASKK